jgi:hypothetical protein
MEDDSAATTGAGGVSDDDLRVDVALSSSSVPKATTTRGGAALLRGSVGLRIERSLSLLRAAMGRSRGPMPLPHALRGSANRCTVEFKTVRKFFIVRTTTADGRTVPQGPPPLTHQPNPPPPPQQLQSEEVGPFKLSLHPLETVRSLRMKVRLRVDPNYPIEGVTLMISKRHLDNDSHLLRDTGVLDGAMLSADITPHPTPVMMNRVNITKEVELVAPLPGLRHIGEVMAGNAMLFTALFELLENPALVAPASSSPSAQSISLGSSSNGGDGQRTAAAIWELLLSLPTHKDLTVAVASASASSTEPVTKEWEGLLNAEKWHRSVYVMQIIDSMLQPAPDVAGLPLSPDVSGVDSEDEDGLTGPLVSGFEAPEERRARVAGEFKHSLETSGGLKRVLDILMADASSSSTVSPSPPSPTTAAAAVGTAAPAAATATAAMGRAVALRIVKLSLFGEEQGEQQDEKQEETPTLLLNSTVTSDASGNVVGRLLDRLVVIALDAHQQQATAAAAAAAAKSRKNGGSGVDPHGVGRDVDEDDVDDNGSVTSSSSSSSSDSSDSDSSDEDDDGGGGSGAGTTASAGRSAGDDLISDALATVSLVLKRHPLLVQRLAASPLCEQLVASLLVDSPTLEVRQRVRDLCLGALRPLAPKLSRCLVARLALPSSPAIAAASVSVPISDDCWTCESIFDVLQTLVNDCRSEKSGGSGTHGRDSTSMTDDYEEELDLSLMASVVVRRLIRFSDSSRASPKLAPGGLSQLREKSESAETPKASLGEMDVEASTPTSTSISTAQASVHTRSKSGANGDTSFMLAGYLDLLAQILLADPVAATVTAGGGGGGVLRGTAWEFDLVPSLVHDFLFAMPDKANWTRTPVCQSKPLSSKSARAATVPSALKLLRVACATRPGDLERTLHELQEARAAKSDDDSEEKGGDGGQAIGVERGGGLTELAALELRGRWQFECSYDAKAPGTQFVGLKNQGCTCYMNSSLQQLFMIEPLRRAILSAEVDYPTKLPGTIFEPDELEDEEVLVEWIITPEGGSAEGKEGLVVWRPATVLNWSPDEQLHTIRFYDFPVEYTINSTGGSGSSDSAATSSSSTLSSQNSPLPGGILRYHVLRGLGSASGDATEGVEQVCTGRVTVVPRQAAPSLALEKATSEEQTVRVLEQMQRTFAHLSRSEKRAFDPRPLVEASKCMALEYNVFQQNDAPEFYDKLMHKLEDALRPHREPFRAYCRCFGLEVVNQSIPREQTQRFNAREKGDTMMKLELKVQGMDSVEEGLAEMVKDEVMDGDNKIEFEDSDGNTAKLSGVRRTCVSSLPNVLVLHLKRFDLDFTTFETVKVNDRCSFPTRLNMKPYTKEGMAERDAQAAQELEKGEQEKEQLRQQQQQTLQQPEEQMTKEPSAAVDSSNKASFDVEPSRGGAAATVENTGSSSTSSSAPSTTATQQAAELDDGDFFYNLRGVLIHAGVSQSGHYYSFIKDKETGQWFRFDDEDVTPWDLKNLERQCFGGKVVKTVQRGHGQPNQRVEHELIANALMVFYDKERPVELDDDDDDTNGTGTADLSPSAPCGNQVGAASLAGKKGDSQTEGEDASTKVPAKGEGALLAPGEKNLDGSPGAEMTDYDIQEKKGEEFGMVSLSGSAAYESEVYESNLRFRRLGYLFDVDTHKFFRQIMAGTAGLAYPTNPGQPPSDPHLFLTVAATTTADSGEKLATSPLQLKVLQFCLRFFLDTALHSRERRGTPQWTELCRSAFFQHPAFAVWFVDALVTDRHDHWLLEYLNSSRCPDYYARRAFVELVAAACLALAPLEQPLIDAEANRAAAAAVLENLKNHSVLLEDSLLKNHSILKQVSVALREQGVGANGEGGADPSRVRLLQNQAHSAHSMIGDVEQKVAILSQKLADATVIYKDAHQALSETLAMIPPTPPISPSSESVPSQLLQRRVQLCSLRKNSHGSVADFVQCITTRLLPSASEGEVSGGGGAVHTDELFLLVQLLAEGSQSIRRCLVSHDTIARLAYVALGYRRSPTEVLYLCVPPSIRSRINTEDGEDTLALRKHPEPTSILEAVAALADVPQVAKKPLLTELGAGWQFERLTPEAERALTIVFREHGRVQNAEGSGDGPALLSNAHRSSMDMYDFKCYLESTGARTPSKYQLQSILATYGENSLLDLDGFLRYYRAQALMNPKDVWSHLRSFRFRSDLTRPGDDASGGADGGGGSKTEGAVPDTEVKGDELTTSDSGSTASERWKLKLPPASTSALTCFYFYELAVLHVHESVPSIIRQTFGPGVAADLLNFKGTDRVLSDALFELAECWGSDDSGGKVAIVLLLVALEIEDEHQRDRIDLVLMRDDRALLTCALNLVEGKGTGSPGSSPQRQRGGGSSGGSGEDGVAPPRRVPTTEEWWLVSRYVRVLGKLFESEACTQVLRSDMRMARIWEYVRSTLFTHERQMDQLLEQQRVMRQLQAQQGCGAGGGCWGPAAAMLESSDFNVLRPPPETIVVVGAGSTFVNGTYVRYRQEEFDGCPCWAMKCITGEVIALYRCCLSSNQHVWYLSEVKDQDNRISPGTADDRDFYMAPSSINVVAPIAPREIEPPPQPLWQIVSPDGVDPLPEILLGDDDPCDDYDDDDDDDDDEDDWSDNDENTTLGGGVPLPESPGSGT